MKKIGILIVLFPLLVFLAWPPLPLPISIFFCLIPLFYLEKLLRNKNNLWFFISFFFAFCLFNIAIAWWVWNSSPGGTIAMILINALFMTLPWCIYRYASKFFHNAIPFLLLIISWLSLEFIHYHWDINFPWLNFGNVFSKMPEWIQWYEYSGVLGGSLWVLIVNVWLFLFFTTKKRKYLLLQAIAIIIPVSSSYFIGYHINIKSGKSIEVVCVQPSFDPWTEKFDKDPIDLLNETVKIALKSLDSSTELLLLPETALTQTIDTRYLNNDQQILILRNLRNQFPKLNILTGADLQQIYYSKNKPTKSARKSTFGNVFFDLFNSAVFIDQKNNSSWYHKSILVPGSEQMPWLHLFPWLEKFAVKLDGIQGTLGKNPAPQLLGNNKISVVPAICYESVFGEYLGKFMKLDTLPKAIGIITNDAWWGKTPGYLQHLYYGSIRAIEHRKWIARSANTGVSCLIDSRGKIHSPTHWWEKTSVKGTIYLNSTQTFYSKNGDLIGRASLLSLCILSLFHLFQLLRKKLLVK